MARREDKFLINIQHLNIPFSTIYTTYAYAVNSFKDIILNSDLSYVKNSIRHIYVNTVMPFKQRLMKTRLKALGMARPVLAINTSIYTDEEDSSRLPTIFFNTDVSDMWNVEGYSDPIFKVRKLEDNIDVALYMVPKGATLNVEFTFVEDYITKIQNLREAWNKMRHRNWYYEEDSTITAVLPIDSVLNVAYQLGMVSDPTEFKNYSYYDVYKFLLPYTSNLFRLKYEFDSGRGMWEIMIEYDCTYIVRPDVMNVGESEVVGFVNRNYTLTRSFFIDIVVPSTFVLRGYDMVDLSGVDDQVVRPPKPKDIEDITDISDPSKDPGYILVPGTKPSDPRNYAKSFIPEYLKINPRPMMEELIDGKQLISSSGYTHDGVNPWIDCTSLLLDDLLGFYTKLKDLKVGVHNFFLIVYLENSKKKAITAYNINYEEFRIYDDHLQQMIEGFYDLYVYVDMKEYQDYLKGIGYS